MLACWEAVSSMGMAVQMHFIPGQAANIRSMASKFPATTVILDHMETGIRYRKAFPVFFLLDELWCLAPLGLSMRMGVYLALACVPPLAFSPFSQRTLIRSAYHTHSPRRKSA